MIVSNIKLKNWRNFRSVEVALGRRMFLVGPNASGKSNFLDALRFLRDIAKSEGGGLQRAVSERGGISKIRCLAARKEPQVEIEIHLSESQGQEPLWKYGIGIKQEIRGLRQPFIYYEKVWKKDDLILKRPGKQDKKDELRLKQTHLEQINANLEFRDIAKFFQSIDYMHLIPQVLRYPEIFTGPPVKEDPFGRSFLERVVQTPERTRRARLKKIENALQIAVPQLKKLTDTRDERGVPHLEVVYEHWRPKAGKQSENQFSDGTLRLIAFLWSILDGDSLLLMEEPELSLHSGIVTRLPGLIWRIQNKRKRQILISTHSADLLSDKGIGGEEVLLLMPDPEGTKIEPASSKKDVKSLLDSGFSVAEAALPRTEPKDITQLSLFND
ncbi:MAG: AAA family ATPase [Ignavibacteriaceae bacterium]|nr:AAA family ATPase [Ignavibacteriaceae bacterium]